MQKTIKLNDSNSIPQFGLGVYQIEPGEATYKAVYDAIKQGYRHIDTAHAYQNERSVGEAVRAAIADGLVTREEIWITSKLWITDYTDPEAMNKTLDRLGLEYVDLMLLHQQFGDYVAGYKLLEKAKELGQVRSIGLSNFDERLDDLLANTTVPPAITQVELHPYHQRRRLKERMAPLGTVFESWYPLGHGDPKLLSEPAIVAAAEAHGKTPAQALLRWHIQEGNVVFPRTTNPAHMAENIDIFDFELSPEEQAAISALDRDRGYYDVPLEEMEARFSTFVPAD
ncbi:MAG: aldo/keto reductase [Corynebacterium sp.]|nr:aldo/keto reductase [Corynebacterium sp.]